MIKIIIYSETIVDKKVNDFIIEKINYISNFYLNSIKWFYKKVVPEIGINREIVILTLNDKPIGLMILKFNNRKISTLLIDKNYLRKGYGTILINKAKELLKTDKPKITVDEDKLIYFDNFLIKNNFKLSYKRVKEYNNREEYFYNY